MSLRGDKLRLQVSDKREPTALYTRGTHYRASEDLGGKIEEEAEEAKYK